MERLDEFDRDEDRDAGEEDYEMVFSVNDEAHRTYVAPNLQELQAMPLMDKFEQYEKFLERLGE